MGTCLISYNVHAISEVLAQLNQEEAERDEQAVGALSPYLRQHMNRFGEYQLDLTQPPPALKYDMHITSCTRRTRRRFGKPSGTPLLFLQHYRGSMDNWDPALLNGFAKDRTAITFDNAGVGFATVEVHDNVADMAHHAIAFIGALNLTQVDLLGFSLGGYIAQHITLSRPNLVRRLILAGTGPGKGEGTQDLNPAILTLHRCHHRRTERFPYSLNIPKPAGRQVQPTGTGSKREKANATRFSLV